MAGFNVYGFLDFQLGVVQLNVYDMLNGIVLVLIEILILIFELGLIYCYFGGGFILVQLIIVDQIDMIFEVVVEMYLFVLLGMSWLSFVNLLLEDYGNIVCVYDCQGELVVFLCGYESMLEMVVFGLWISFYDFGLLVVGLINDYCGEGDYLGCEIVIDMMLCVVCSQYGLGLCIEYVGNQYFFYYVGVNNFYQSWMEGYLVIGDGLVVLINGVNGNVLYMEICNVVVDVMGWQINVFYCFFEFDIFQVMLVSMIGCFVLNEVVFLDMCQ